MCPYILKVDPPVTRDYAPKTTPIAYVALLEQSQASPQGPRMQLLVTLLTEKLTPLTFDAASVPAFGDADMAAFEAMPTVAGETRTQDLCRRAAPYVTRAFALDVKAVKL